MVRLLHTADWQLGRTFAGVDGDAGAALREARFEAVRTMAALARENAVDAVLVAGDVFDDGGVSRRTIERALAATGEFTGPWVLLPGNHDAAVAGGLWDRLIAAGLPSRIVPVLEPVPIYLADGAVAVLPAPLSARRTLEDITGWMDAAITPSSVMRIGLAHGAVTGRLPVGADAQNPIAATRADTARLDYMALGDQHGCGEVAPRTWYSGTPEPDRFPHNDPGWALLVEIDAPGASPRVQKLRTAGYEWQTRPVELVAVDADQIAARLDTALRDIGRRDRCVLRLELRGALGLAARAALDDAIVGLAATLRHLVLDDVIIAEPDAADTARLASEPRMAEVAGRLLGASREGTDLEQRAVAALALRLLFAQARSVG